MKDVLFQSDLYVFFLFWKETRQEQTNKRTSFAKARDPLNKTLTYYL